MKASRTFSLDFEVIEEMRKRGLGSRWVNRVLRKALGLDKSEEERVNELFTAEPITDLVEEKERIAKVRWSEKDGGKASRQTS